MDDNVIGRMRVACWISKATDTHSEYVVLNGFLLQQGLHERVSVLGYMYIASFVEVLIRPHQLYVDLFYTGAVSYTNAMDQSPWEYGSQSVEQFSRLLWHLTAANGVHKNQPFRPSPEWEEFRTLHPTGFQQYPSEYYLCSL